MTETMSQHGGAADLIGDASRLAARLDRILSQQESLYASLDELSAGQASLIDAGDGEGLLAVLADRQALVSQLQQSNDEIAPLQRRWSEIMETLSVEERRRFEHRVDEMGRVMARISERDESDRVKLQARQEEVGRRLSEVTRSKSAMFAYGRPRGGARYQDREG